uniref:Rh type C glycoprotein-like protein n=1 Tax=Ciona savignyi TaxID=51511 RepID=Q3BBX6_CIOSA|nr:Rh type C glycoprotein-like protein [Ciona savignyi]
MSNTRGKATALLLAAEAVFLLLFGLFVDYDVAAGPRNNSLSMDTTLDHYYPIYQDVHVMMLIGFGFLMTFLKRHGFGSVGFNFLLTCFIIQWSTLVNGWFALIGSNAGRILINIKSLLEADFAVATVLISFGAVLGVASPVQLIVMATIEVVCYNVSIYVGIVQFQATDIGGSMFIHAFGAYFGLAVARVLYKKSQTQSKKEGSEYHSDIFAMIGTLFLWLYWPSFNAGPGSGTERHRAVINTVLSLSACAVVTFALSAVTDKKNKLDMVHIQNATLAGGVAMGASADLIVQPFGALLIGSAAAIVSTLGFKYLQPLLQRTIKLHDTCGVHNLHGMPGVLGVVASAIAAAVADRASYQDSYHELFKNASRTSGANGGYQIAALAAVLGIAIFTGTITGFLLKLPIWDNLSEEELFEDEVFWECPEGDWNQESQNDTNGVEKGGEVSALA